MTVTSKAMPDVALAGATTCEPTAGALGRGAAGVRGAELLGTALAPAAGGCGAGGDFLPSRATRTAPTTHSPMPASFHQGKPTGRPWTTANTATTSATRTKSATPIALT